MNRNFFFMFFLVIYGIQSLYGATRTSIATGTWDNSNTSIWDCGCVPAATDNIVIANTYTITLGAGRQVNNLTIQSGAVLDNSANYIIFGAGNGTYTINGIHKGTGDLRFMGDYSISGTGTISNTGTWVPWNSNRTLSILTGTSLEIHGNIDAAGGYYINLYTANNSTINLVNASIIMERGDDVVVDNLGTISITNGDLNLKNDSPFANYGTLNITGGGINLEYNSYVINYSLVDISGDILGVNSGIGASYFCPEANSTSKIGGRVFPTGNEGELLATGTSVFTSISVEPNTIEYNGTNQTIKNPDGSSFGYTLGTYSNLIISNSGTKTLEANTSINGNLSIQNAATLDVSATPYNIDLKGNWSNTSTVSLTERTGTVTFSGSTAQSITASAVAGGESFYNLIINNTSATGVTLNNPAIVSNALTLTDGIVITDASSILTLLDDATSGAGTSSVFVDGPMKKIGNDAFVFPLGDGTVWARMGISAPSTATTEYTAQYINAVYGDGNVTGDLSTNGSTHHVSGLEYWTLAQGVNDDDIKITLYWENASVKKITDCSDLTIGHFTGSDWVEETATTNGGSSCTGTGSGSITTNAVVASYSPFTLASKYGGWTTNPLPIELLSFTGEQNAEGQLVLNWTTATETNNDYFTVERGTPSVLRTFPSKGGDTLGLIFTPIGIVQGAGNSTAPLYYHLLDETPSPPAGGGGLEGLYYRLKQTDFDGKSSYSQIVSVSLHNSGAVNIYPNPAEGTVNLYLHSENEEIIRISVIDKLGRTIINKEENMEKGVNSIHLDVSDLNAGIYLLQIALKSGIMAQKQLLISN